MTNRTVSLLMLYVGALGVAGVLLAMVVSIGGGSSELKPWLAPAIAVTCQTTMLFLGRRYILSHGLAEAAGRAGVALVSIVTLSLLGALGIMWLLHVIFGAVADSLNISLPLWFGFVWLGVRHQQIWHPALKTSVR